MTSKKAKILEFSIENSNLATLAGDHITNR